MKIETRRSFKIIRERDNLKKRVEQLQQKLKNYEWLSSMGHYIIDAKLVIEEYHKLKAEREKYSKTVESLRKNLESTKKSREEILTKLNKQQEDVVKPLIKQAIDYKRENVALKEKNSEL